MSNPDEQDPRQELYRAFRDDLNRTASERYYSEDDLIDIFDTAGDNGDDYLRMEALLLGARLYPDSADLLERRAIFYLYLDRRAFKSFLDDNPAMDTPLWRILRLNLLQPGDDATPRAMEAFLRDSGNLTDEEVIQFVQLAGALGQTDWLLAHLDELRKHVSYMPTLLYEAAAQAEDSGLYEKSAQLVAELTDLEPYNPDYWTMHATLNVMMNRPDEASADIDYALAIDPDNLEALRAKLGILAQTDRMDEFHALVDRILAKAPDDAEVAMMGLEHAADSARMCAILSAIDGHVAWSYPLAAKAAAADYPALDSVLSALAAEELNDPAEWREIARTAFEAGNYGAVTTVMQTFRRCTGADLDCAMYLYQILYRTGNYAMVVQMYMASQENFNLAEDGNSLKATAMFVMAMLRADMSESARAFLSQMQNEMKKIDADVPGLNIQLYAMTSFAADALARLDSTEPTDWNKYDPLGFDKH